MLKGGLDAFRGGLRLFDAVTLVLALPLSTAGYARISGKPWTPPIGFIVGAIAAIVGLWMASAKLNHLYDAPFERSPTLDLVRPLRTFSTVALVLVSVAIVADQHLIPNLLVGIYTAFALALFVAMRIGWRVLVVAVPQAPRVVRHVHGGPGVNESRGASARTFMGDSVERPREDPPPVDADLETTGAPASLRADHHRDAARAASALENVRSCMDEVTYTPGNPNVLAMTKYVRINRRDGAARRPRIGSAAPGSQDSCERECTRRSYGPEASFSRNDSGVETVLRVEGVLDAVTIADLCPMADAIVSEGRRLVMLDVTAMRRIDSSGVGVIVSLFKRCRAFGGVVRVKGLNGQPLDVFTLLRLDGIFDL